MYSPNSPLRIALETAKCEPSTAWLCLVALDFSPYERKGRAEVLELRSRGRA